MRNIPAKKKFRKFHVSLTICNVVWQALDFWAFTEFPRRMSIFNKTQYEILDYTHLTWSSGTRDTVTSRARKHASSFHDCFPNGLSAYFAWFPEVGQERTWVCAYPREKLFHLSLRGPTESWPGHLFHALSSYWTDKLSWSTIWYSSYCLMFAYRTFP